MRYVDERLLDMRSGRREAPEAACLYAQFPYQRVVFEYHRLLDHSADLSQQGTGKTKTCIDYLDSRVDERDHLETILVVTPVGVMKTWLREIRKHSRRYTDADVCILHGHWKKRLKMLDGSPGIYVINYEGVRALRKRRNLSQLKWDVVIADEMTKLKTFNSQASRAMHDFADHCTAKRIGLSGTPITQSPLDAWSMYRFLEPEVFGKSYFTFRNKFAVMRKKYVGSHSFNEIVGYQNLEELTRLLYSVAVRYTKEECLPDLPPKLDQLLEVPWPPDQLKIYEEMRKLMLASISGAHIPASNALAKIIKLRQICNGWIYDETKKAIRTKKNPKLAALKDFLADSTGPFVLWIEFTEDSNLLFEELTALGLVTRRITGDVPNDKREQTIDDFQEGKVDVAICQVTCAQYGVTLTRSNTNIWYGLPWSVLNYLQAVDRTHRIGQTRKVHNVQICMENSIDTGQAKALEHRIDLGRKVVDAEFVKHLVQGDLWTHTGAQGVGS